MEPMENPTNTQPITAGSILSRLSRRPSSVDRKVLPITSSMTLKIKAEREKMVLAMALRSL